MYVLTWFSTIINYFRTIQLTVLGVNVSLFTLLFGTLIFSALCKGFIKIIFEQK